MGKLGTDPMTGRWRADPKTRAHSESGVRDTEGFYVQADLGFTLEGAWSGGMGIGNELQESRSGPCCSQRASCKNAFLLLPFVLFPSKQRHDFQSH